MRIYSIKRDLIIKNSINEVFSFFQKPENLSKITPSNLGFNIITPSPIVMNVGTLIDYTIKVIGIRIHWRTLISSYNPPYEFVDEQLRGPYKYWYHKHEFISSDEGTIVKDYISYALPFGIFGKLLHKLFVCRQLHKIFDYRACAIKSIFKNDD
jgi:ligand-binding SRPBCC domain-containing protein